MEQAPQTIQISTKDHDLLIESSTKLTIVMSTLDRIEKATNDRLAKVESDKLNTSTFDKALAEGEKIHDSHDKRLDAIETKVNIFTGVIIAAQVIIPLAFKYLFNQ